MTLDTDHWDKRDYLAFILFYLANADGKLEEEELNYITDRLGKDHLQHILDSTHQCSDVQCLRIMRELRPRFYPGEVGLTSLQTEMQELCEADGRFSQYEHAVVNLVMKQL